MIYGFQICRTKKCNPVFAGHSQADLESISAVESSDQAKHKVQQIAQQAPSDMQDLQRFAVQPKDMAQTRADYFTEQMMERVSPKISVMPQPLDKTLVGMVSPELEEHVVNYWKSKFSTVYNHRILEMDEVDSEEEKRVIVQQNKKYD